jgi:hypothetical protein
MSSSYSLETMIINVDELEQQIQQINSSGKRYSVEFDDVMSDFGEDISFLEQMNKELIDEVVINVEAKIDLTPLYSLSGLRYLSLLEDYPAIDLNYFTNLQCLYAVWSKKIKNLSECCTLKEFTLRKFSPKTKDLTDLKNLTLLEEVCLVGGNLKSVKGISSFSKLQQLTLAYIRGLDDISDIAKLSIRELEIEKCPKLQDVTPISSMQHIEILRLTGIAPLENLSFIKGMKKLKKLSVMDTNVLDGNFDWCKDHPTLEYVGFDDKRHYNTRWEALNDYLKMKSNG